MSGTDFTALSPEDAVRRLAQRWNLTEEMARSRYTREIAEFPESASTTRAESLMEKLWRNKLLMAGWSYAERGIPVFPLHSVHNGACSCGNPECAHKGKHPRVAGGHKSATKDRNVITKWWTQWPDANVAVPTGAASGLLVVDIDPRNGGPGDRAEFVEQFGAIPRTAESKTGGGGRHLYFRDTGRKVPKQLAPGIDLKGEGGYVVAPPSIHASGNSYKWDRLPGQFAEPPEWLRDRIIAPRAKERVESAPNERARSEGQRNDNLTSLAGVMRRRGMSRQAIEAALLEENQQCNPPLPADEVRRIAESISRYAPIDAAPLKGLETARLATRCLADIDAKPVSWLWPGHIARGKLTIFAGDPGLGKSQITASIAGIVTRGGRWPVSNEKCEPADVLFLSAEDDAADTIRPRLEAVGADLSRVHIVDGVLVGCTRGATAANRGFSLKLDVEALDSKLTALGGVAALFIDPLTAFLGDADSHKNAEVRSLLMPLNELLARHNTAVIGVSHLNKAEGKQALMRVSGSLAFVAAARAAYLVAPDAKDNSRRLFLPMKNNLGPDASGLAFRINKATVSSSAGPLETSHVVWESEPIPLTANEALRAENQSGSASAVDGAVDWLRDTLAEGSVAASNIFERATTDGIAKSTLQRASKMLGVQKG
jgi:hypothetical protein